VPLPLNDSLHVGVFPNPCVVVGALPVGVDVQDQVFVISNNLKVMRSIRYHISFKIYLVPNPDNASKMMQIYKYMHPQPGNILCICQCSVADPDLHLFNCPGSGCVLGMLIRIQEITVSLQ
jgi:hypothetical protein